MTNSTIPTAIAGVARRTIEVLRERDWFQGDYFDRDMVTRGADLDDVRVDVCGAINLACGLDVDAPWDDHPHHALARATGEALRDYVPIEPDPALDLPTLIGHWNDDPRRTWADIIAALEGVAAAHDKGESL